MSRAIAWIRKSQGSDDAIGLAIQRRDVRSLAEQLADEVETLDLGIQSGFSSMTRDGSGVIDKQPAVVETVEQLRGGRFDYLVAYDDTRICRDEYYEIIKYAAIRGDAELAFVADVAQDELTHDIKRRIERDTKEKEIAKSREAIEQRKDNGYDHGRPKFGMTYDDAGHYQVPGEDFETVLRIIELDEADHTRREIASKVDVALGTVQNVLSRRDWYLDRRKTAEN